MINKYVVVWEFLLTLRETAGPLATGRSFFLSRAMIGVNGSQAPEGIVNGFTGLLGGPGSLALGGWLQLGTEGLTTLNCSSVCNPVTPTRAYGDSKWSTFE